MKWSALEFDVTAVYGGIRGLFNRKSWMKAMRIIEPVHEISNSVVCAASKASDQPAHMRSLIRAFASRLSIL